MLHKKPRARPEGSVTVVPFVLAASCSRQGQSNLGGTVRKESTWGLSWQTTAVNFPLLALKILSLLITDQTLFSVTLWYGLK